MKRMKKIFVLMSAILITIALPFQSFALNNDTNVNINLSKLKINEIETFVEKQMKKGKIPGMSVVIVKGDKTIYQNGFGYANIEEDKMVTDKTLFELSSNSKAFTGLGILKLQDDGLINLEDPITKYIPWLKMKYKGKEVEITLEQFFHHTSGIPFKSIDKIPVTNDDDALEKTVRTLIDIELDSEPGEMFQYATINYDVLGLVIEKVTGESYEKYAEDNLLKPMNLSNTHLYRSKDIKDDIAKGYKIGFLKPQVYQAPEYRGNKPAGYYISNGEDMAKWLKIQLGTYKDSKFNEELIKQSHNANRKVAPLGDGSSYAAGWFVYQKGGGEISHGGNNPNYSSFIVFSPEKQIGIAVLSNLNSEFVGDIGQGINERLQGNEYNTNTKDMNKSVNLISILIICTTTLIIVSTLYFMFNCLLEIMKKERKFFKKDIKGILKSLISLIFIIGVTYCIYLIPNILYMGVTWDFVFVWLPKTVKIALYLTYITLWGVYIFSLITSFYKKKGDKSILILLLLSIVSGLGNSLIIFTINMAINSSNNLKLKLLVYFALGLILYVYGQKLVRVKLIEITNNIIYSKRMKIVKALLKTPYDQFENIEKDRIQTTLNNDTERISGFVNILIGGVTSAVTLICCFMYLGFVNIYALLLAVIMILFIASIYYFVGKYANKVGEESRDLQNKFFKFINDLIEGFKELTFNEKRKNEFQVDMDESCNKYKVKRGQSQLAFANMFVIGELLFTLAIGAVAFVFPLILKNLDGTSIASYVFILLYMTGPVHGILDTIPNAIEVRISWKRINDLLNTIDQGEYKKLEERDRNINKKIKLKLNQAEYEYNNKEGRNFKVGPIDYEFNSGEIVFITGGNGSGKSTLAKLISGLYKTSKGNVTLNDEKITEAILSQQYSTIFSDFYLFDKLYGVDYKNKEEDIKRYLEVLQLDKKVDIEDGKFSTTKLSTGQKKRLALLVTYLEDRPIYLFDEWAADQDPEFRKFFYNTLLPELKERDKCVIAVTHDDHYFDMADKVLKMELGKIV